ncbi:MAG: hypothetical protein KF851_00360 [Pirellulaceae bacterium]|nr:hypothetical protein [Pirellulaceae bacterium]
MFNRPLWHLLVMFCIVGKTTLVASEQPRPNTELPTKYLSSFHSLPIALILPIAPTSLNVGPISGGPENVLAGFQWRQKTSPKRQRVNRPTQDDVAVLQKRQQELTADYRGLEEKLFLLFEVERQNNPQRSQLLQQAYVASQQRKTAEALANAETALRKGDYAEAERLQQRIIAELQSLIEMLQAEVVDNRLRDALKRHLEYAQEIERLQRVQRSLRNQLDQSSTPADLSPAQDQTADRTSALDDKMKRDDEAMNPNSTEDNASGEVEADADGGKEASDDSNATQDGSSNDGNPSQANPSADNPIRQRIQAAEKRMREASKRLKDGQTDAAQDEMQAAERELAQAKRQLDEILRQMREEEQEIALARLEERFRKMLERQLRASEQTKTADLTPEIERLADFEIACRKLSNDEREILVEADRALGLLREDGTSVAIPQAVEQLRADLEQVAARLGTFKTGKVTQEIQQDVVDTLVYLIESLEKAQRDLQAEKQQRRSGGSGGARPGEQPLVNSIAELKLIRRLQDRVHQRHKRYAQLLDNPDDSIGRATKDDLREALQRLAEQQRKLVMVAREIELLAQERE